MRSLTTKPEHVVAVVGAGPAGLYAADELAENGVGVVLINRDIKPGGLAEYGIYPNKYKMKGGLRKQFQRILKRPLITYLGNTSVGKAGDVSLAALRQMGFSAVLVTVGAQGTKWLGLPGEELTGVYHAKDLVYHYNGLPPFSERSFAIGRQAAIVGVGNVMLDIAHWLIRDQKIESVTAVARRGPAEVKFTKKEMQIVAQNLDLAALDAEIARVAPVMEAVGQDVAEAKGFILSALKRAQEAVSETRFQFRFLSSPSQILGDEHGRVSGLLLENTTLVAQEEGGRTKVQKLGTTHRLDVDTVVFAIGDQVDERLGLPTNWGEFVKNPQPRYPINDFSYETYDPETEQAIKGVFVAGWAREASSGLVGAARKDGRNGAHAVLAYLDALGNADGSVPDPHHTLREHLQEAGCLFVDKAAWHKVEAGETAVAEEQGLPEYKFTTNRAMLDLIRQS